MPIVPFAPQPPKGRALQRPIEVPAAQEPWVLMAAAQMDAQGRLVEPHRGTIEDRRDEHPDFITTTVFPGEKLPMHAVTKLGQDAGAQDLDNQLVEKWLKDRGK